MVTVGEVAASCLREVGRPFHKRQPKSKPTNTHVSHMFNSTCLRVLSRSLFPITLVPHPAPALAPPPLSSGYFLSWCRSVVTPYPSPTPGLCLFSGIFSSPSPSLSPGKRGEVEGFGDGVHTCYLF